MSCVGQTIQHSLRGEPKTKLSVLVVEDDFGDFDAVARALRKMDCFEARSVRAKTLEAARLAARETEFDVFLIDYNLGAESGARFLQEVGGRGCRSLPILLTGLLDREVHDIAMRAGAICCINKADLSPTLLETTIRYALYTHQRESEMAALLRSLATTGRSPADAIAECGRLDASQVPQQ